MTTTVFHLSSENEHNRSEAMTSSRIINFFAGLKKQNILRGVSQKLCKPPWLMV